MVRARFVAQVSVFAAALAAVFLLSAGAAAADFRLVVPHTIPGSSVANQTPALVFTLTGVGPLTRRADIPAAALDDPSFALFSASGELFIANRHGNAGGGTGSISRFVFDASGNAVPNGTITGNALDSVHGLAFSPTTGELFAADWSTGLISRFVFDAAGNAIANGTIDTGGLVLGVAVSARGELFASDYGALIKRWLIDPLSGAATPNGIIPLPGATNLHGLTFDARGSLFAADAGSGRVFRISFDSEGTPTIDLAFPVDGAPIGVAFSPAGELFVSQHTGGSLVRFLFDASGAPVANGSFDTGVTLGGVAISGGAGASDPGTVLAGIVDTVNGLPPSAFANRNSAHTLTNLLDNAAQHVAAGRFGPAVNVIDSVIHRTDGCASLGNADKNDFIVDCAAQAAVHAQLAILRDQLATLAARPAKGKDKKQ